LKRKKPRAIKRRNHKPDQTAGGRGWTRMQRDTGVGLSDRRSAKKRGRSQGGKVKKPAQKGVFRPSQPPQGDRRGKKCFEGGGTAQKGPKTNLWVQEETPRREVVTFVRP